MAKLNKVIGAVETCPNCKQEMFCNETEYNGEKKLQWQNKEGKSHYLARTYVDGKQVFPCRGIGGTKVPGTDDTHTYNTTPESKPVWEQPDDITKEQQLLSDGLKQMRYLAYVFTKETHPELPDSSNLFGQIVNANITHLIGMAKILAIKKESS